MKKHIPYIPRLVLRIGIIILWGALRFIELLTGVITKKLKEIINKPI